MNTTPWLLLACLVSGACSTTSPPSTSPLAEVPANPATPAEAAAADYLAIAQDTAFANWPSCWQQLREVTSLEIVDDPAAWQQFAAERVATHDAAALALARELVPPDPAAAFARFAASAAGQSLGAAEGRAHAVAWHLIDVPDETLATFRDPAQVGEVARAQVREAVALAQDGVMRDLAQFAVKIAAIAITADQAMTIDAFHRTEDGAAWLATRRDARRRTRDRVVALQGEAMDRGIVKDRFADIGPLPRAEFAPPEEPR